MPLRSPHNHQAALPLHLTLAMLPWLASNAASQLSRSGCKGLSAPLPPLPGAAARLAESWQALLADPQLADAVREEARKRAADFLIGVEQYQQARFERDVEEPPAVFSRGSARLLDYGAGDARAPSILLVPSLINRYYILDLTRKLSFARYLRSRGMRVFVVDWGMPSPLERHFNCALYVTEILVPMAEWVRANTGGGMVPGGYCMGGLLVLALAHIRPDLASACAFFATPWDFLAPDFPHFGMNEAEIAALAKYIDSREHFPAEMIHTLFHCANPYAFQDKLRDFAGKDKDSPATQEFLAIEHWVNDGVPMTRGVAQDCLVEWTQRNSPARGQWHVGGQVVDPRTLKMPCFVAAPQDDRIVPSGCALPLAKLLKRSTLVQSSSGHVGMVVGSRRKAALWEPFVQWIDRQFS